MADGPFLPIRLYDLLIVFRMNRKYIVDSANTITTAATTIISPCT